MIRYELPITHRPDVDGSVSSSRHVPFYLAAEIMSLGWRKLLEDLGPGVLAPEDIAVLHVEFTFKHEVFTDPVGVSVVVEHVGTSSIRFVLTMDQHGREVASGTTAVARTTADRTSAAPLDDVQRSRLSALL